MEDRVVPVVFRFPGSLAPTAHHVAVVATFNRWDPSAHPMTQTPSGEWRATIYLPPGQVLYCIWIDGVSWLDPYDDGRIPNGWGSEYSVRRVRADEGALAASRSRLTRSLEPALSPRRRF